MQQEENWSHIISCESRFSTSVFNDVLSFIDLILLFVKREIVTNYKQTILGPLWFFIQPMLTTAMFVVIFSRIANLSTDAVPPILFYLSGVTAWNYFAECLTKTSTTFKDNAHLFGKVYFPRLVVPMSIVLSSLTKFLIQFGLFVVILLFYVVSGKYAIQPNLYILLTPLLLLIMAVLSLGMGMIITSLTTKYRDLALLIQFAVQLLMYATPVILPMSAMSEKYRWLIVANPMSSVIETFRFAFLGKGMLNWLHLGYSLGIAMLMFGVGVYIFNKVEKSFTDTV